jgi:hypothetical protein
MNSERAFATFRIAGNSLRPQEVTELMGRQPTLSYAKGEKYQKKNRTYVGRTGVWYISTDGLVESNQLEDHVRFLFSVLKLSPDRLKSLRRLIDNQSLHAVMTVFWSGSPDARLPHSLPARDADTLFTLARDIPFRIERPDFANDLDAGGSMRL